MFLSFVFFLNIRICFCHFWKSLVFVNRGSVKICTTKDTLRLAWTCGRRDPPQIEHWFWNKVNHLTTVCYSGRSLRSLVLFGRGSSFSGRREHKLNGKNKKNARSKRKKKRYGGWTICDHSFLRRSLYMKTMMALESVLLWCLSIFFFLFGFFKKKLIDLSVQVLFIFCLFVCLYLLMITLQSL